MSVASGGQIIVSNVTASLLQSGVADLAYRLSDLGSHRLRGLAEPERLWQVDAPDLPGAFPPVHSERPGPVGLPVHRSSLVGRTDDERRVSPRSLPTTGSSRSPASVAWARRGWPCTWHVVSCPSTGRSGS